MQVLTDTFCNRPQHHQTFSFSISRDFGATHFCILQFPFLFLFLITRYCQRLFNFQNHLTNQNKIDKMRYVAAYLLAQLGGHQSPSEADIKKILGSVGIDFDEAKAKKVIESLKGKNVEDLIEKGKKKLATMPSGGGVAAAAAGPAAAAAPAKEEKKEEKKKVEEEEKSDDDMGFGLFD